MPTRKLLAAVRVAELLIYSRIPSKLGNMGQSPHTGFFFFFFENTETYNNTATPKLLVAVRVAELLIYSRTPSKLGDVLLLIIRYVCCYYLLKLLKYI